MKLRKGHASWLIALGAALPPVAVVGAALLELIGLLPQGSAQQLANMLRAALAELPELAVPFVSKW